MPPIRFRIRKLMIVVGLVALNLAVGRALFASRRIDVLEGGGVLWIAMQLGAYRAIRARAKRPRFWIGFLGFGMAATVTFLAGVTFPRSVAGRAWGAYLITYMDLAERALVAWQKTGANRVALGIAEVATMGLSWALPILLTAVAGGILASVVPASGLGLHAASPEPRAT